MKIRENTGICIFGIRPLCGGANLAKWTSFYKSLVKIVYNPGKKTQNVRNFQTKKKKKKMSAKNLVRGGVGGGGSDNVRQNVLYTFPTAFVFFV